jgi:hypothetical protein
MRAWGNVNMEARDKIRGIKVKISLGHVQIP